MKGYNLSKMIKIKGRKEGIVLSVDKNSSFIDFFGEFKILTEDQNEFFSGTKILGLDGINLSDDEKKVFKNYLLDKGYELISFEYVVEEKKEKKSVYKRKKPIFKSSEEKKVASEIEEPIDLSLKQNDGEIVSKVMDEALSDSLFHKGTVRSGIKLESDKNIVVVGDVNPGAELIAKGNIVVLGRLKGFAHAGSDGSEDKIIAAWKLQPTQLRIADYITVPPEEELEDVSYPEMAVIDKGRVIIKSYQ